MADGSAGAGRPVAVVMGVAGSGKSTLGRLIAERLALPFLEGDDLHPAANRARMARGEPLDDADRRPWLDAVAAWLAARGAAGGIAACSALKRSYRDRLRRAGPVRFILLDAAPELLAARLGARRGHFMPASLLDSQLATLERPGADEAALVLDAQEAPATLVAAATAWLTRSASRTEG